MKSTGQDMARLLAGKSSIEECSIQELEAWTNEYPWSAAHQLLLALKLKEQHPANYRKQLQKAAIFFNDPLWLDFLLHGESYTGTISLPKEDEKIIPPIPVPVPNTNTEPVIEEKISERIGTDQNKPVDEILIPESAEKFETSDEADIETASENSNHEGETTADRSNHSGEPDYADQTEIAAIENSQEEPLDPEKEFIEETDGDSRKSEIPELPILNLKLNEAEAAPLVFEPYHTVDYFASQGIKFVSEERPSDRFGMQLKSFTEWLKTMKKLPHTGAESVAEAEPESDRKVDKMAEASLTDRDIWTEAMAEVWEKQGNPQKAMDIYHKLSLLEPAKTAYFARKIEKLKEQLK